MEKVKKALKQVAAGALELFLPNHCPGCHRPLLNDSSPICPRCTFYLEKADPSLLRETICRLPGGYDAFRRIFTLWLFDKTGTVQHIHQGLKYKNRPYVGFSLGKLMGATFILPLHFEHRPNLIIPIPLHRRRLLERGYNQSALLASGLNAVSKIQVNEKTLIRSSHTKSQTGLDKRERLANVQHAFSVSNKTEVDGKHILLVDDVLTTGATLLSAALPLKAAGASQISIATLAMARL